MLKIINVSTDDEYRFVGLVEGEEVSSTYLVHGEAHLVGLPTLSVCTPFDGGEWTPITGSLRDKIREGTFDENDAHLAIAKYSEING